jgi:hypothetical protein
MSSMRIIYGKIITNRTSQEGWLAPALPTAGASPSS